MSALEDPPIPPPKTEDVDEESFSDSSQEFDGPEQYNGGQATAQVQKRKGGRKPVGGSYIRSVSQRLYPARSMQLPRRGSNGIVKLRLPFASGGPSTSSN